MRTGPLMRISFSNASIEHNDYWRDLTNLDATVLFDRVILVSHEAAYKQWVSFPDAIILPLLLSISKESFSDVLYTLWPSSGHVFRPRTQSSPHAARWLKMISGVSEIEVPTGFWQPIRDTVVRNILGYLPELDDTGEAVEPSTAEPRSSTKVKPVVTYISRQESARRLDEKDHEGLIDALQALEKQGVCDFNILDTERATLVEQISLTAKSTVVIVALSMRLFTFLRWHYAKCICMYD